MAATTVRLKPCSNPESKMKTIQKDEAAKNVQKGSGEFVTPEVNIFETKDGYILEAEMPGVNKDGVEITLDGNEITIVGHAGRDEVNGQPLVRERRGADFRRVFELDPAINTSGIMAKVDQGILMVTLPRSEKVKPRKVVVGD